MRAGGRRRRVGIVAVLFVVCAGAASAVAVPAHSGPTARAAHATLPCQNPAATRCLDLIAGGVDPNGIPLDPRWGYQTAGVPVENVIDFCNPIFLPPPDLTTVNPACTSEQPDWDGPGNARSAFVCAHGGGPGQGHSNYGVATYTGGSVYFEDHSSSWGGDDDYTMNLYTAGRGSLKGNKAGGYIHIEFDSDETIDHFGTAWWQSLHDKVDSGIVSGSFNGHFVGQHAIVTGLMGIDWVHTPGMESHPVYAFAAESSPGDWGFFVRDNGDEGYCSNDLHHVQFTGNRYTFRFPWQRDASAVSYSLSVHDGLAGSFGIDQAVPGASVVINPVKNDGVYLTVTMPPPSSLADQLAPFYDGEIKFHWTAGKPGQFYKGPCLTSPSPCQSKQEDDPEQLLESLLGPLLTPAQKTAIDNAITPPARPDVNLPGNKITRRPLTRFPRQPLHKPTVRIVRDPAKIRRDELRWQMICTDLKGKVPPKLQAVCR